MIDPNQCQANPNVLDWSPFSLGPMPTPIRCQNKPTYLAMEIVPGRDGKKGMMTLCTSCTDKMMQYDDYNNRVELREL